MWWHVMTGIDLRMYNGDVFKTESNTTNSNSVIVQWIDAFPMGWMCHISSQSIPKS